MAMPPMQSLSGKVVNKLMLVELADATDIGAAAYNVSTSDLENSSMAGAAVNGAAWSSVGPLNKTLLLDLNAAGWRKRWKTRP